jgi:glycosyltransferase involved in cell wall biosynthesis
MKILQMSRCFFPYQGGASVRTYQIAKNLVELGHEVHLLVHHPSSIGHATLESECEAYEEVDGIHVYRLPYFRPSYAYYAASVPMMMFKALSIMSKESIDVVLSHNPPYIVGLASYKAAKLMGRPLVLNLHDPWGSKHHNKFEYHVGMFLEKLICRKADKITYAGKTIPKTLNSRHGIPLEKFVHVPNGADVERFEVAKKDVEKARKKYNIPKGKKIAFFVGSLAKWNGVQYIIDAARLSKDKDLLFLVVGGGRDEEEIRKLAKGMKNIRFTGLVSYDDVPALMNLADVCLAPFPRAQSVGWEQYESLNPHLLLEYMACGKPIVASDLPGIRDLLADNRGTLIPPEDPDAILKSVMHLVKNKKKSSAMGRKVKKYAKEEIRWKKSGEIVERVLKGVLG